MTVLMILFVAYLIGINPLNEMRTNPQQTYSSPSFNINHEGLLSLDLLNKIFDLLLNHFNNA